MTVSTAATGASRIEAWSTSSELPPLCRVHGLATLLPSFR